MNKTVFALLLLFFIYIVSFNVQAKSSSQSKPQNSITIEITKDSLQAKIEDISARQGIDEGIKSQVLSIYQSSQDNFTNRENFITRINDYSQAIKQAPVTTKKIQREIEITQAKINKQKTEDFSKIPAEELVQRLIIEKQKLSNLDEQLKKSENELILQQSRPQVIREEIVNAKQDLETSQKKFGAPVNKKEPQIETEASRIHLKTILDLRSTELKMLDIEAISNPARVDLLKAEFKLIDTQRNALIPTITAIDLLLTERREQEAKNIQAALTQAENDLAGKHPLIQNLTRENIQYSRDLQIINTKIEDYTDKKTKLDIEANIINKDFKNAEKKISLAVLSPALGKILREERRNLTTQDQFIIESESIQNETALTSLDQFKVEDKLKQLNDVGSGLQQLMDTQVDHKLPTDERMMIQAELRVLLNNQQELLNKLANDYTTYLRTLGDFDFARQQMNIQANKFASYLDENLLWVKSSDPINKQFISQLIDSLKWLLSPTNWLNVFKDTSNLLLNNILFIFISLFGTPLLYLSKKWGKNKLHITLIHFKSTQVDSFINTLQSLGYLLVLTLPTPLFFYYVGWFLSRTVHVIEFTKAMGIGLQSASVSLFIFQFFFYLFAENGIASRMFEWQKNNVRLLRKQIHWLQFIAIITSFLIASTTVSSLPNHSDSLGRLAFIINMFAVAVFWSNLLNPTKGIIKEIIANNPIGWLNKSVYFWYPSIIIIPLVLIGFAVAGYYLSALQLQEQIISSIRLIFLMIIIHQLVICWLTTVNRQLAINNSIQGIKPIHSNENTFVGSSDPSLLTGIQLIDIPKINAQTIKLLNVFIGFTLVIGFFMIWKNLIPAFSFLERIVLWQHLVNIDNQENYQPITLMNLFVAGLYVFIATVSVRNFSGIMELLVFRRLSIEVGGRYAVNQLAKYILVSIGFICVANELGGSWSQVQWLVAALSVGLGFGLQEIFANMVSGIILLFERPIRIGDTVTIGSVTGKVSRIEIRATTLIDMDQKDLIVPNKTFITSQLVNWTLSDSVTRVVIPVNIAYGSDIELAHKVMIETIKSVPKILTEPEPSVLLIGFGENSLNFSIRIFVGELLHRMLVINELHIRLEKALREHNIELSLPPREIYLHSNTHPIEEKDQDLKDAIGT